MSAWDGETRRVDVVILTAIRLELDAVLAVEAGAVPGSEWELTTGPTARSRRATRMRSSPIAGCCNNLGNGLSADLVERCCAHAARLAEGLAALPDVEVMNKVRLNQLVAAIAFCAFGSGLPLRLAAKSRLARSSQDPHATTDDEDVCRSLDAIVRAHAAGA